jgi:hypothetical protein
MSLWKNTDANTSAPLFAAAQVKLAPTQDNANTLYANTTASGIISGQTVGLFGVDTTEQGIAANPKGGHAGWNLVTTGSGGRAGRVHSETLVAMGSMTGDGSASANDDPVFADA